MEAAIDQIKAFIPNKLDSQRVKRILLVTTYRTGSSFVGDLLQQSDPHSYYVYEPLRSISSMSRNDESRRSNASNLIRSLFTCNYEAIPDYNEYIQQNLVFFRRNRYAKNLCRRMKQNLKTCTNARIAQEMCLRSPVHVIKTTRLDLKDVPKLDLPAGTEIVYLQRDPRAIYNSRKENPWCAGNCRDIDVLCKKREEDLRTLEKWLKNSITLVRYEDLATNSLPETKRLFKRLGLNYNRRVKSFVKTHTNDASRTDKLFSTYRNSTAAATRWKNELKPREIAKLQTACRYVIEQAGYEFVWRFDSVFYWSHSWSNNKNNENSRVSFQQTKSIPPWHYHHRMELLFSEEKLISFYRHP